MGHARLAALLLATVLPTLPLLGCNTVAGLGQDLESFGRRIRKNDENHHAQATAARRAQADGGVAQEWEPKKASEQANEHQERLFERADLPARRPSPESDQSEQALETMYQDEIEQGRQ